MSHLLTCEICGNSFQAKRTDSKTCSPKCRKALSRGGYKPKAIKCDINDLLYTARPACRVCGRGEEAGHGSSGTLFAYAKSGHILCSDCFRDGYFLIEGGKIVRRLSWINWLKRYVNGKLGKHRPDLYEFLTRDCIRKEQST